MTVVVKTAMLLVSLTMEQEMVVALALILMPFRSSAHRRNRRVGQRHSAEGVSGSGNGQITTGAAIAHHSHRRVYRLVFQIIEFRYELARPEQVAFS